jgi:hypothetical protein
VKKYEMSREQTAPVGRTHYQTDSPFDYDPVRFLNTKKRECQFKNEPLPIGHKKKFQEGVRFFSLTVIKTICQWVRHHEPDRPNLKLFF